MLLVVSVALLCTFIAWAHFAVLDEVKRGNGKVIPSRQTQVVQSLEGGIVQSLLVQEGDIVQKSQPLINIADTKFASELGEIRERRAALAARVTRLEAEATGKQNLMFSDDLRQTGARAVETEQSVFDTRARKIAQDIDVIAQAEARLTESLKLLNRELDLTRRLYAQKV